MCWQTFRQKQHFIVWRHKERASSPSPTLRRNNRAALKKAWGIGRRKQLGLMWALRFIHMCSRDSSFVITCCCRSKRENESRDRGCGDKPSFWEPLDYHKDPSEYWEGSVRAAGGTEDLKDLTDRSWVLFSEDLWAKALLNHCCRPSWIVRLTTWGGLNEFCK